MLALIFACCGSPATPLQARGQSDDVATFAEHAQPTLARSCAFPACHGDRRRGLDLFAVGRSRLVPDPDLIELQYEPLDTAEVMHNLRSTLQFVDVLEPERSELLLRPLPASAGGRGHRGGVLFGTRDDPGYQALLDWIVEDIDQR